MLENKLAVVTNLSLKRSKPDVNALDKLTVLVADDRCEQRIVVERIVLAGDAERPIGPADLHQRMGLGMGMLGDCLAEIEDANPAVPAGTQVRQAIHLADDTSSGSGQAIAMANILRLHGKSGSLRGTKAPPHRRSSRHPVRSASATTAQPGRGRRTVRR